MTTLGELCGTLNIVFSIHISLSTILNLIVNNSAGRAAYFFVALQIN